MKRKDSILRAIAGLGYKSYDQELTVTLTNYASSWTNPSWGYANISRPANVPTKAYPKLVKGSGGFLVPLANEATPCRLMAPGGTAGSTLSITIRWHWRII